MRDERRLIEWGKDALIALLTLSALWLLTMTPLVRDSGLQELLRPKESPGVGSSGGAAGTAMLPARLAVTGEGGRLGVQYDEERLKEVFPPLGALLGDALASAGQPEAISEEEWQRRLGRRGVYFDFAGEAPLPALERWLQGPGDTELTGCARRLLLCGGVGDLVLLWWGEGGSGQFYSCSTALTQALHLEPATEGIDFNGAYFAFESGALSQVLDPYTLVTEGEQSGAGYTVSVPLAAEEERLAVLSALSFNSQNPAPVNGGQVYLDGGDRLTVGAGGSVSYRAARGEKYPAGPSLADGVEASWALAEGALGPLCGEARLYLVSVEEAGGALRVSFGYLLDGCTVQLGGQGWAAQFLIRDGYITQFTLRFRCYTAAGERTLLLPMDKAAVMLPDLSAGRRELVLQYLDGGGTEVLPQWVAA